MFLDYLVRALWRWWLWQRRVKRFRTWDAIPAVVKSCGVIDDTFGERLSLVFGYEVKGEPFWGSALSQKRSIGSANRLEDDLLEGHTLSIRANPADASLCGVLNEDNPQWPWAFQEWSRFPFDCSSSRRLVGGNGAVLFPLHLFNFPDDQQPSQASNYT
jgi:hypothetical protein